MTCSACGAAFRREDPVTSRLGEVFHRPCVDRWQEDDTVTPLPAELFGFPLR